MNPAPSWRWVTALQKLREAEMMAFSTLHFGRFATSRSKCVKLCRLSLRFSINWVLSWQWTELHLGRITETGTHENLIGNSMDSTEFNLTYPSTTPPTGSYQSCICSISSKFSLYFKSLRVLKDVGSDRACNNVYLIPVDNVAYSDIWRKDVWVVEPGKCPCQLATDHSWITGVGHPNSVHNLVPRYIGVSAFCREGFFGRADAYQIAVTRFLIGCHQEYLSPSKVEFRPSKRIVIFELDPA